MVSQMMSYLSNTAERESYCKWIADSDDDDVVEIPQPTLATAEQPCSDDMKDIQETTLEHEERQNNGVQLANAGGGNVKLGNNHSARSSTCALV